MIIKTNKSMFFPSEGIILSIVRYVITCMVISRSSYCIFWRALSPYDCRVRLVRVTQHHFHIKSNHLVISNDPSFRE